MKKKYLPQQIKIILGKEYPSVKVEENIILNTLKPWYDPEKGYTLTFKIYFKWDEFEINVKDCLFYLNSLGRLVWRGPLRNRKDIIFETNLKLYEKIREALVSQEWATLIGRGRLNYKPVIMAEVKDKEDNLLKALMKTL